MRFLPLILGVALVAHGALADGVIPFPGTEPLTWTDDLSERMHKAALHDVDKVIADSVAQRASFWHRDGSSVQAYERSIEPNREHFKRILGVVDQRLPVVMERFGDGKPRIRGAEVFANVEEPSHDEDDPSLVATGKLFNAYQVRWPVLEGVHGEGLLLEPKGVIGAETYGSVVVVPDAGQTPEQVAGLAPGVDAHLQFARYLAELGYEVVVPTLIDRGTEGSGNANLVMTNQPHREWIHRQGYMMGRPLIGFEVQKVLSVIDWFEKKKAGPQVGVAGYGEGGLIALYAAAVDKRIKATLVSGYFKSRQNTWEEPLYRNVWGLLREFGDAEIGLLVAPRRLAIGYCDEPRVEGPPPILKDQKRCAAPGRLTTPAFSEVKAEFERMSGMAHHCAVAADAGSEAGLEFFSKLFENDQEKALNHFAVKVESAYENPLAHRIDGNEFLEGRVLEQEIHLASKLPVLLKDLRQDFDPAARQLRQVKELEAYVQKLIQESGHMRDDAFLYKLLPQYRGEPWTLAASFDTNPPGPFIDSAKDYRKLFWNEVIGKIDDPLPPMHPRSRKVYDEPKWAGYDVVLDVGEEGFAWGVLCVPKDLKPGEKRPVVVCQHGRHGLPKNVIEGDQPAYHNFAARLAEQGFITFAPHNLYQKEEYYRTLSRKGNTVKLSMFSFILRHHEQLLNWLETLPFVDAKRIGFYGLSYGGESAIRLPPLLDRYCLSICSGDFNDWTRKVASTDDRHSFMFTDEWEMPYFNMGSTFSYAELSYLMFPRPFMVERGHHDGVAPDYWVASEFAKTRWLYSQFGMGDRVQIEFFNGGHTIHGQGTFEFLHQQLDWPKR